ncbi:DUF2147 domain-containing protein [Aureivirga sp. CE67]|uniref:DUF2147 domain-containing protein n=1 Tax=Aureivirga sp. CE67 TaxID=1788983 RepID=UPI0018CB7936|nr:DUF2147 domain-containing protein [Aureivirga sp. CE67]
MKKIILFATFLLSNLAIFAQNEADNILGVWETEDKDGKIEIYKCGENYCGKLLEGSDIFEKDGITPKKDVKNPDPKLQSRDIPGITILTNLTFDGEEYEDGKIYNAKNGKTYKCYIWLEDGDLFLRGYLGLPILGQTTKWTRIK